MENFQEPYNFVWHLPGLLATGGKPLSSYQVQWLKEQGFQVVVSLEAMPDSCARLIKGGFVWLELDLDDYCSSDNFSVADLPDVVWQSFAGFLDDSLASSKAVYVHCSAGITRSSRLVRHYLYLREHPTTTVSTES